MDTDITWKNEPLGYVLVKSPFKLMTFSCQSRAVLVVKYGLLAQEMGVDNSPLYTIITILNPTKLNHNLNNPSRLLVQTNKELDLKKTSQRG